MVLRWCREWPPATAGFQPAKTRLSEPRGKASILFDSCWQHVETGSGSRSLLCKPSVKARPFWLCRVAPSTGTTTKKLKRRQLLGKIGVKLTKLSKTSRKHRRVHPSVLQVGTLPVLSVAALVRAQCKGLRTCVPSHGDSRAIGIFVRPFRLRASERPALDSD